MFWKWGGNNTKIYGEGVLNGNGQRWWNEFAGKQILDEDNTYLRPVLFYAENTTGWSVEGITFKDSPCWHNFVVTCKSTQATLSHLRPYILTPKGTSIRLYVQGHCRHRGLQRK